MLSGATVALFLLCAGRWALAAPKFEGLAPLSNPADHDKLGIIPVSSVPVGELPPECTDFTVICQAEYTVRVYGPSVGPPLPLPPRQPLTLPCVCVWLYLRVTAG